MGRMGDFTSLCTNGNFEGSTAFLASAAFPLYPGQNWSKGGTLTYTFDATTSHSGTTSLKIVGVGTVVTSSLQQMVSVTPGRIVYVTLWVQTTGMVGGQTQLRVSWYLNDHSTRTIVASSWAAITVNQGWTPYSFRAIVPTGINNMLIDFQNVNLNGNAWVDDVCVTLL
jgi:hypothetical protein